MTGYPRIRKSGLLLNYSGRANISTVDETGASLGSGKRAVGRLLNRPAV